MKQKNPFDEMVRENQFTLWQIIKKKRLPNDAQEMNDFYSTTTVDERKQTEFTTFGNLGWYLQIYL